MAQWTASKCTINTNYFLDYQNVTDVIFRREAHKIKKEDMRGETNDLALRRELHCAAYNALIAIISCTQTEEKFYQAFLFKDDPDKVSTK